MGVTKASSHSLDEALNAVLRLLQRRKTPYMVMGGLALSIWGRVRVTQDLDMVVGLDEKEEADFLKSLKQADFLPTTPRAVEGHRLLVCRYLKTTRGLPIQVDFFFARGDYQKRALLRSVNIALGRRRLRVIAPEDLILHKLIADRPIDHLDVKTVVEEQRGRLDREYLALWAERLGLTVRLNKFC